MNLIKERFLNLIDREKNIYELADLFPQNRRKVDTYVDLLRDPVNGGSLHLEGDRLIGDKEYSITDDVPNFTDNYASSKEWERLNKQFLNYHRSLSAYTLINSTPITNYIAYQSGFGEIKNASVLDVGAGTGQSYGSFFLYPETIDYYLVDPNLRLLHDQFIRMYPKLTLLKMAHILAYAESLPFKNESFDYIISISSIDHFDNYDRFMEETFRVLKPGGKFLVASHLDIPASEEDLTRQSSKVFSFTFLERLSRFLYYKRYAVGRDDHVLHIKDEKPIEHSMQGAGFDIVKKERFKRHFFIVGKKQS